MTILDGAHVFLDELFANLAATGIDVQKFVMDHLCYRVKSLEEYTRCKSEFGKIAKLLHEAEINGRPIAVFRLYSPIEYKNRKVFCIELPAPKKGKQTITGWEHVEFVIQESFEEFLDRYPRVKFDTSGITKPHNAEIELSFGKLSVKFHHVALEDAITRE